MNKTPLFDDYNVLLLKKRVSTKIYNCQILIDFSKMAKNALNAIFVVV